MAEALFGFAEPFSVALVDVNPDAAEVLTVGGVAVVNDSTDPNEVPTLLDPIAQKKYVVPGDRPVTGPENGCAATPAPRFVPPLGGVRVPKLSLHTPGLLALYRNHPVADDPFGFPVPFNVAVVDPTGPAVDVVIVGGDGAVNDNTAPNDVPDAFAATAQ